MQKTHSLDYYKWDEFPSDNSTKPNLEVQTTKPNLEVQTTKTTLLKFPLCAAWSSFSTQWEHIAGQTKTIIEKLHPEMTLTRVSSKDMCTSDDEKLLTMLVAFRYANKFNSEHGWVAVHVYLASEHYEFSYEFQPVHESIVNTTTLKEHNSNRGVLTGYPPEFWHPWQVAWGRPNADRNPITLSILGIIILPFVLVLLHAYLTH